MVITPVGRLSAVQRMPVNRSRSRRSGARSAERLQAHRVQHEVRVPQFVEGIGAQTADVAGAIDGAHVASSHVDHRNVAEAGDRDRRTGEGAVAVRGRVPPESPTVGLTPARHGGVTAQDADRADPGTGSRGDGHGSVSAVYRERGPHLGRDRDALIAWRTRQRVCGGWRTGLGRQRRVVAPAGDGPLDQNRTGVVASQRYGDGGTEPDRGDRVVGTVVCPRSTWRTVGSIVDRVVAEDFETVVDGSEIEG